MRTRTATQALAVLLVVALAFSGVAMASNIPAGTSVSVRLNQTVSSESAHSGDSVDGSLTRDIVVKGTTVARKGAPVTLKVTYAKASGRLKDPGALTLRLASINGQAVTSSSVSRKGENHKKSNATKIGGGALAGALIGGLAGGGKGAAIGAGVGAGAGTGVAMATGKKDVEIPVESVLTFTITGGSSTARR